MDEKTYTHEVVTTGNVHSVGKHGWKYEINENTTRSTLAYSKFWDEVFLSSGNYNLDIKTFDVASCPEGCKYGRYFYDEHELSFNLEFGLIQSLLFDISSSNSITSSAISISGTFASI